MKKENRDAKKNCIYMVKKQEGGKDYSASVA